MRIMTILLLSAPTIRPHGEGSMKRLLIVALGGALGAVSRYLLSDVAYLLFGTGFAWGTLAVNLLGCFAFGWLWGGPVERGALGPDTRAFLLTGFAGALTTFSTYAHETMAALRDGEYGPALWNVGANNIGGLVAFFLGLRLGQAL